MCAYTSNLDGSCRRRVCLYNREWLPCETVVLKARDQIIEFLSCRSLNRRHINADMRLKGFNAEATSHALKLIEASGIATAEHGKSGMGKLWTLCR